MLVWVLVDRLEGRGRRKDNLLFIKQNVEQVLVKGINEMREKYASEDPHEE